MKLNVIHKAFIGLIATLLIMLSNASSAHAAQYGDSPHDHDGMVCMLGSISDEAAVILPAPDVAPELIVTPIVTVVTPFISIIYLAPQSRAPPPRAPPVSL